MRWIAAIEAALRGGATIRVVCPNPDNLPVMEAASMESAHRHSGSEAADDLRLHLRPAMAMRDLDAKAQGSLEVRVVGTLPGIGPARVQGLTDMS
jgi:hypothetical protein